MRVLKFGASLVFLLAFAVSTKVMFAQSALRDPVRVTCSCDDAVGQAYANALRKALAESKRFREIASGDELTQEPIRINIVSLPIGDGPNGQPRTAISVVSVRGDSMAHQLIATCDKIEIESSARSVLVDLVSWK